MTIMKNWKNDNEIILICLWFLKTFLQGSSFKSDKTTAIVEQFGGEAVNLIKVCLNSNDYKFFTPAARCLSDISEGYGTDILKVINNEVIEVKIFYNFLEIT